MHCVCQDLRRDFPDLVCYDRFVALIPRVLIPMMLYLVDRCSRSLRTGIYYVDSTPLAVCHPKRSHQHRTMKGWASWAGPPGGKTSVGWFYGLKVHLLINHLGQIVQVRITSGSTHEANLRVLYQLTHDLIGWVFGDRGYLLSTQKKDFLERDGELMIAAKPRKGMAQAAWPLGDTPGSGD